MGQRFDCCDVRRQNFEFGEIVKFDSSLSSLIQNIRQQNQDAIQKSQIIKDRNQTYYRGMLDKEGKKTGYGQLAKKQFGYFGFFKDNLPNGYGILVNSPTDYYVGDFVNGLQHGVGRQYIENCSFQGEYENGFRRKGIFKKNGFQYQGTFVQNKFHGYGSLDIQDKCSYQGQFQYGKYHGKGILSFQNGNVYDGQFKEGKYQGRGKHLWSNGDIFQGVYADGKRTNKGRFTKDKVKYKFDAKNKARMCRNESIDSFKDKLEVTQSAVTTKYYSQEKKGHLYLV